MLCQWLAFEAIPCHFGADCCDMTAGWCGERAARGASASPVGVEQEELPPCRGRLRAAWELEREYTLAVQVVGNQMQGFVYGERILEWEDATDPWQSGCVGLGLKNGRTMFTALSLCPAT